MAQVIQFWTLKNRATADRPCLTAFNNEPYTAGLYLSHLRPYTLACYYTKVQTPLVRYVVDLLRICL